MQVVLKKISTSDLEPLYHGESTDCPKNIANFYLSINTQTNVFTYFSDRALSNVCGVVNLNNREEQLKITGICYGAVLKIFGQIAQAHRKKNYPESLCYASCGGCQCDRN